ncbi:FAD-binding oxidoreductase [Oceanospirillaceae bacterium]|nr:FAD-binding oxidoreductase [Oceanospirillaceae bacterium]
MALATLLPNYENDCGWYKNLPKRQPSATLKGAIKADMVVIGAGFTGLAAARRLAQLAPDKHIVLLDALAIAMASSGRNSGFMIDLPHTLNSHSYTTHAQTDHNMIAFNRSGIAYAKSVVEEHNIACDWSETGKIHGATSATGSKSLLAYGKGLETLNEPFSLLSKQQMQDMTGLSYYHSGVFTPGTVMMQPAAFVQGCADHLPDNVSLYENTPVTEYVWGSVSGKKGKPSQSPIKPHVLKTPHGQITTAQVLLCNNGFAQSFGQQKGRLVHVCTYGSMTGPMNEDQQKRLGGQKSWGLIPSHPAGATIRRTADQRLLIRSVFTCNPGLKYGQSQLKNIKAQHESSFKRRFYMLPELELEDTWGGLLCMSNNEASFFGECQPNVFAAVCQNGLGIARGTASGKLLAELALGQNSKLLQQQLTQTGPSWMPPKIITNIGVSATIALQEMRAGKEG